MTIDGAENRNIVRIVVKLVSPRPLCANSYV